MKRHISDQTVQNDAGQQDSGQKGSGLRVREFLRIEREGMLHPSIRALTERAPDAPDSAAGDVAGLSQFLRIERGIEV